MGLSEGEPFFSLAHTNKCLIETGFSIIQGERLEVIFNLDNRIIKEWWVRGEMMGLLEGEPILSLALPKNVGSKRDSVLFEERGYRSSVNKCRRAINIYSSAQRW